MIIISEAPIIPYREERCINFRRNLCSLAAGNPSNNRASLEPRSLTQGLQEFLTGGGGAGVTQNTSFKIVCDKFKNFVGSLTVGTRLPLVLLQMTFLMTF